MLWLAWHLPLLCFFPYSSLHFCEPNRAMGRHEVIPAFIAILEPPGCIGSEGARL
jgi:hypothetical protein